MLSTWTASSVSESFYCLLWAPVFVETWIPPWCVCKATCVSVWATSAQVNPSWDEWDMWWYRSFYIAVVTYCEIAHFVDIQLRKSLCIHMFPMFDHLMSRWSGVGGSMPKFCVSGSLPPQTCYLTLKNVLSLRCVLKHACHKVINRKAKNVWILRSWKCRRVTPAVRLM